MQPPPRAGARRGRATLPPTHQTLLLQEREPSARVQTGRPCELHRYRTHATVADDVLRRAAELDAQAVILGRVGRRGATVHLLGPSVSAEVTARAPARVEVVTVDGAARADAAPVGAAPAPA